MLTLQSGSMNVFVRGIALFWLTIIGGVMRPAQFQRSCILELGPDFLEGQASAGKTIIFGRQKPFK